MLTIFLQILGATGYLSNKILFSRVERSPDAERQKILRIWSWIAYLIGLPAWITVFLLEKNYIVAAVELGALPAMVYGLTIAIKGLGKKMPFLDNLARFAIVIGLGLSFYEAGGFNQWTQFYEIIISSGFLLGTYALAKHKISGYFWIIWGNIGAILLMATQAYYILMFQQFISMFFMIDAFLIRRKKDVLRIA